MLWVKLSQLSKTVLSFFKMHDGFIQYESTLAFGCAESPVPVENALPMRPSAEES